MLIYNKSMSGLWEFVKVISFVGEGRSQVEHYRSEEVGTVDGADFVRLRPPPSTL
jgi:hypothetical protein